MLKIAGIYFVTTVLFPFYIDFLCYGEITYNFIFALGAVMSAVLTTMALHLRS